MATYKLVDSEKLDADLTTVADAIRAKTGGEEPLSFPESMAGEVDAVFEAGKDAVLNDFWENYQDGGNRELYQYAFDYMNDDVFKPKYGITSKVTNIDRLFYRYKGTKGPMIFIENGLPFDTSGVKVSFGLIFSGVITASPKISTISLSSIGSIFCYAYELKTIQELELKEDGSQSISTDMFGYCSKLENLIITGTIGKNGFDIHWSTKLSKASILSILNALSATTTSLTVTLSATAVNNAFETSAGAADGSTSEEWTTLIATKPNWTISLA